jgi:hypothetical protein
MAHVRKGVLVPSRQWSKHLHAWKRIFWKKQRQAEKKAIRCSGETGTRLDTGRRLQPP